jgi:hypothetical protein
MLSLALFTHAITAYAGPAVLKRNGSDWITLHEDGGVIIASSKSSSIKLVRAGSGFSITSKSGVCQVKAKEDKLKIYGPSGGMLLKIKITPEKIKVMRTEDDPEPWSIKSKSSGDLKVKRGETELGKVAFYPSKAEIKVKDMIGSEVCSMAATAISTAPAVCLMNGLPDESAVMVFALLNAMGQ